MALDFVVLGSDGRPAKSVALNPDTHWALVTAARSKRIEVPGGLDDYYQDIEFPSQQLGELTAELELLRKDEVRSPLHAFLDDLIHLVDVARAANQSVHALAD